MRQSKLSAQFCLSTNKSMVSVSSTKYQIPPLLAKLSDYYFFTDSSALTSVSVPHR